MSLETVPMYRVVCDYDGCKASPSDDGDYVAWSDADGAVYQAEESDWFVGKLDAHFCPAHAPSWCDECDERHEDDCAVTL